MLPEDRKFISLFRQSSMLHRIVFEGCVNTAPKHTCISDVELHSGVVGIVVIELGLGQFNIHRLSVHYNHRNFYASLAYSSKMKEEDETMSFQYALQQ